jgi:Tfp pilus assembly protein PilN
MIDINLIAARRAQRQRAVTLMRLAFYGIFGLAIIIVLMYAWMSIQISLVGGSIAEAEAKLSAPDMQANLSRIQFLEGEISQLTPKVTVLQKVHASERRWIEVLRDIGGSVPANVWVSTLVSRRADKGQQITLSGSSYSQRLIGAFMLALQPAAWSDQLQLVQADTNLGRKNERLVDFEVVVPLKEAIGIDLLTKEEPSGPAE